jgi:hypothetical protein
VAGTSGLGSRQSRPPCRYMNAVTTARDW